MFVKVVLLILLANQCSASPAWTSNLNISGRLKAFYDAGSPFIVIFHLFLVIMLVSWYENGHRFARLFPPKPYSGTAAVQDERFEFVRHFKRSENIEGTSGSTLNSATLPYQHSRSDEQVGGKWAPGNQAAGPANKHDGAPDSSVLSVTTSNPDRRSPYSDISQRGGKLTEEQIASFKDVFQVRLYFKRPHC